MKCEKCHQKIYDPGCKPMNIDNWVKYLQITEPESPYKPLEFLCGERGVNMEYHDKPEYLDYIGPFVLVYGIDSSCRYPRHKRYGVWFMTSNYCEPFDFFDSKEEAIKYMNDKFVEWFK